MGEPLTTKNRGMADYIFVEVERETSEDRKHEKTSLWRRLGVVDLGANPSSHLGFKDLSVREVPVLQRSLRARGGHGDG